MQPPLRRVREIDVTASYLSCVPLLDDSKSGTVPLGHTTTLSFVISTIENDEMDQEISYIHEMLLRIALLKSTYKWSIRIHGEDVCAGA